MKKVLKTTAAVAAVLIAGGAATYFAVTKPVNDDNYAFAMFDMAMQVETNAGAANNWNHHRTPIALDAQPAPMMNRDTLYSFTVVDATSDITVTIPEIKDGRYVSIQVVEQGHFNYMVGYGAGTYTIKADETTDFVAIIIRTQLDPTNPDDVASANALQDQYILDLGDAPRVDFERQNWNLAQFMWHHKKWVSEAQEHGVLGAMAAEDKIDQDLLNRGAALATGLLPADAAIYISGIHSLNTEQCYVATYEVPAQVDAELGFYSITIYGDDDYLHTDEHSNVNNETLVLNEDRKTFDVYYGRPSTCGDVDNLLWVPTDNILISFRVYLPTPEIQATGFELPTPQLVK
jgi:hypothetical protein